MSEERWRRVRSLLERARELPRTERAAYLTKACGDDAELRAEIASLIAHGDDSGGILRRSPAESTAGEPPRSPGAERVGAYRIQREIGRGGMGAVYLATRDDDEFERRVALKLLHHGIVSDDIVRRFRNERQILAGIDHPNVAKLYDGGTTGDGLPYLVMEYIEGSRIDEYCDAQKLSIEKRLALFRSVCSAVHFAHQNLVIHRDLKPANILVTAEGEPKLLDFGIAKLLNPELAAATLGTTQADTRLLTPEYASPEQIRGEPITTASDVYALGVLLYRLLTGRSPYRIPGFQLHEIARVICETEPTRPSAAIDEVEEPLDSEGTMRITAASVAGARAVNPERLRRRLKGDLDNIVLMALRKEALRRYSSVEQLSEDIRRFLVGLPVHARRGTSAYRTAKFIGRHKAALGAAAAVLVSLMAFTAFTVRERGRAERAAAKLSAINDFLQEMLGAANPFDGTRHDVKVREVLSNAAGRAEESFESEPEIRAAVQHTIGVAYSRLGLYDEAETQLRSALEFREHTPGNNLSDIADGLQELGRLLHEMGDNDAAEPLLERALAMKRDSGGDEHQGVADSMCDLAQVQWEKGDYGSAESTVREALRLYRRAPGDRQLEIANANVQLAMVLQDKGEREGVELLFRQALEAQVEILGHDHPTVSTTKNNLAAFLREDEEYEVAEPLYRDVLRTDRLVLGEEHPYVAITLNNLALLLYEKGDYEESEELFHEALNLHRKVLGDEHPQIATTLNNLGLLLSRSGDYARAESVQLEAFRMRRKLLGADHPGVGQSLTNLARTQCKMGKHEEAESRFEDSFAILSAGVASDHYWLGESRRAFGVCLTHLGRYPEAEELLNEALDIMKAQFGADHRHTRRAEESLRELYKLWGEPGERDGSWPTG